MSVYSTASGRTEPTHAPPVAGAPLERRHRGLGSGGNLRAAVFGVNDGLVSNASLILGVAGAGADARTVVLAGVAGLAAGAFSMAVGEYVSVRSQRELYEYQIALERDELDAVPRGRGAGARADLRGEGRAQAPGRAGREAPGRRSGARARHARARGARPQSRRARRAVRRAASSFAAFAAGASIPLAAVLLRGRAERAGRRDRGDRRSRCSRSARRCRCSPAASALGSGLRMLALGAARGRRDVRGRPPRRHRGRLMSARGRPVVTLKAGREKSLAHRHPWIFSGAIDRVDGTPGSGDTVAVHTHDGAFARACRVLAVLADPRARLVVRRRGRSTRRGSRVACARPSTRDGGMLDAQHDACRLVHGESDGLPGVIADRYAGTLVVQLSSAGAEAWRDAIVDALVAATGASTVVERSDAEVRQLEGLAPRVGVLRGTLQGPVTIREDGLAYRVDVERGQKTGFYLDQRDSRRRVRALAQGRSGAERVLLHRRLHARRARGRRGERRLDRQLGGSARARAREPRRESRPARRSRALARSRRVRRPAAAAQREPPLRPRDPRPAEVRADRRARAARRARVQGHQPARAEAARARRACSRRSRARAACPPTCSRRSSRARRSMRRSTRRSSGASPRARITRWRWRFRRGSTSRGCWSAQG